MQVSNGNLLNQFGKYNVVLATTNSYITHKGLCMGAGNAFAIDRATNWEFSMFCGNYLQKKFPNDWKFPHLLKYGMIVPYNVNIPYTYKGSVLGIFQTKQYPGAKSFTSLIEYSAQKLIDFCRENPYTTIACGYPGIGLGGLLINEVHPILMYLPNQVTFFKL